MKLTREEKEIVYDALSMKIGYIETRTIHRAKDLIRSNPNFKPKVLTPHQIRFILQIENLMSKIFEQ